jgi:hypothetical protein
MTANVEILQDTLDRTTRDISRWWQANWATIPGGADELTEEVIETGQYHDFVLTEYTRQVLRDRLSTDPWELAGHVVPIANCGTKYCVAGDIVVNNGFTFVGEANDNTATYVIETDRVNEALQQNSWATFRTAEDVAADLLGIGTSEAGTLFAMWRSLPEIWGIAYALTDGALMLPEKLPETMQRTRNLYVNDVEIPATETAVETRRAIFKGLMSVGLSAGQTGWVHLAARELDVLPPATVTVTDLEI